jgi:hypothetical protein
MAVASAKKRKSRFTFTLVQASSRVCKRRGLKSLIPSIKAST